MAIKSLYDEFYRKYEQPNIDKLVVGFSGIDPQKKGSSGSVTPTQEQVINETVRASLENQTIVFDGGEIN